MKYPRIFQAKALDDCTLMIEFTNQEVKKYDIYHLLENPLFVPRKCQTPSYQLKKLLS